MFVNHMPQHSPTHREPAHREPARGQGEGRHENHEQGRHEPKHEGHDRDRHDNHGRRDPRALGRETHHRFEGRRDHDGRVEIQFEGYWFGCGYPWPYWVWEGDLFVVEGPNGIFFIYEYSNPATFIQVVLVD